MHQFLLFSPEVAAARAAGKPIVALESTIISHGMPFPQNVETARQVEAAVRGEGAVPATIAVMGGQIHIGLTAAELEGLGQATGVMLLGPALFAVLGAVLVVLILTSLAPARDAESDIRRARAAVIEFDGPVVQGAGHLLAKHNALRQRATFVRATVEQGKHLVGIVAEHRHIQSVLTRHAARAQHGDVLHPANFFPCSHLESLK